MSRKPGPQTKGQKIAASVDQELKRFQPPSCPSDEGLTKTSSLPAPGEGLKIFLVDPPKSPSPLQHANSATSPKTSNKPVPLNLSHVISIVILQTYLLTYVHHLQMIPPTEATTNNSHAPISFAEILYPSISSLFLHFIHMLNIRGALQFLL